VEEGERMAETILNRLRYSRAEIDQVVALIANHMKFKDVQHMKESTLKRFLRMPEFGEHLELHRMDVMASNRRLENYELAKRKLEEFSEEVLKPEPLITGEDLIAAGYTPGPEFSKMLHAVEDAQLEGRITTADEAMELVREMWPG
jgi:poly(A) polymerase